ncbi:hypothetical protein QBD00_002124 [Ochrobactrum sp. AN78]|nr:hypothetical protein [Ochrobactrum sp. AN78]
MLSAERSWPLTEERRMPPSVLVKANIVTGNRHLFRTTCLG